MTQLASRQQTHPSSTDPPAVDPPSKQTARDLALAEGSLNGLDTEYTDAKRAWAEAMRASGHGAASAEDVMMAVSAMERADEQRRLTRERIEALRQRLHDQRRREILMQAVTGHDIARTEARRHVTEKDEDANRSLLSRLFGRRSR